MNDDLAKVYKRDKRKIKKYSLIFFIIGIPILYFAIENVIQHYAVLNTYDIHLRGPLAQLDADSLIEMMEYNAAKQKGGISVCIFMGVLLVEGLFLHSCFFGKVKMIIDDKGIAVYNLYRRKPNMSFLWEDIEFIRFGYAEGFRGLISEYGMTIGYEYRYNDDNCNIIKEFISINKFEDHEGIRQYLVERNVPCKVEKDSLESKKEIHTMQIVKKGYDEYKSNFGCYMQLSIIIFVFAVLQKIINQNPMLLITSIVGIYFTFRAQIAINYKAYQSFLGIDVNFDDVWHYSEGQFGRFFGARMILNLIYLLFFGIAYICIKSEISTNLKIILLVGIWIIAFFSIIRFYFIDNIASITGEKVSYLVMNNKIIKGNYLKIVCIVGVWLLFFIPVIILSIIHLNDLDYILSLIKKTSYFYIFMNIVIIPIISCILMKFIVDTGCLKDEDGGDDDEQILIK